VCRSITCLDRKYRHRSPGAARNEAAMKEVAADAENLLSSDSTREKLVPGKDRLEIAQLMRGSTGNGDNLYSHGRSASQLRGKGHLPAAGARRQGR